MPVIEALPAVHATVVRDRREPAPGIVVLGLEAPKLARSARPGQFAMVVPPRGELPATALGIYEAQGERVSLFFVACGPRTRELAGARPGDRIAVFGPLGNGFWLENAPGEVALVGGGVGLASLFLPAQALVERGARVTLHYGARTSGLLVDIEKFSAAGVRVLTATDDGSAGFHGYVSQLLDKTNPLPELLLACGPTPMLRATAQIARRRNIPAQLSLEENFGCGVGACWGCVVPLDRASEQAPPFPPAGDAREFVNARVCKEGPVFWAHELRW